MRSYFPTEVALARRCSAQLQDDAGLMEEAGECGKVAERMHRGEMRIMVAYMTGIFSGVTER